MSLGEFIFQRFIDRRSPKLRVSIRWENTRMQVQRPARLSVLKEMAVLQAIRDDAKAMKAAVFTVSSTLNLAPLPEDRIKRLITG
jgi:hypothetical protein